MFMKRLGVVCSCASVLLVAGGATTGGALAEPAVPNGTAGMLRLHIPFGGRSTALSQASLTMNFGHRWGLLPGTLGTPQHAFKPALQAGWMFSGRPVLRVGAIDALRVFSDRANTQADDAIGGGNARFVWIALGVIAVGATVGIAVALANPDDDSEYECNPILPPPPPTPLPPGACPYGGPYPYPP
jgi:hypothetical protein